MPLESSRGIRRKESLVYLPLKALTRLFVYDLKLSILCTLGRGPDLMEAAVCLIAPWRPVSRSFLVYPVTALRIFERSLGLDLLAPLRVASSLGLPWTFPPRILCRRLAGGYFRITCSPNVAIVIGISRPLEHPSSADAYAQTAAHHHTRFAASEVGCGVWWWVGVD
jgi:hypothetical protein